MAYIYKITNDINQKIYVGKTERTVEERFLEHCRVFKRERNEKRPLYSAMRKYGIEHFHIELIEETDNPEEREIYWIEKLGSFKNGYNATLGGDGKKYLDYDLVIDTYKKIKNQKEVAKYLNISEKTVHKILQRRKIQTVAPKNGNKPIFYLDRNGNFISHFESCGDGARWIASQKVSKASIDTIAKRIADVARGERKTAYNYVWRFDKI